MTEQKGCIAHGTLPGMALLIEALNQKKQKETPEEPEEKTDER